LVEAVEVPLETAQAALVTLEQALLEAAQVAMLTPLLLQETV
jgi:hypothetical protein